MQLRNFIITSSLFLASFLTSCSDDASTTSNGAGMLSLDLTVETSLHDPVTGAELDLKAPYSPDGVSLSMTSATGSYSHTWASLSSFPLRQHYFSGDYTLEAFTPGPQTEGFEKPVYRGLARTHVSPDRLQTCPLTVSLVSSAVTVTFDPSLAQSVGEVTAIFHTDGAGEYHSFTPGETRTLYLTPSATTLYLDVTLADGRATRFPAMTFTTLGACLYDCVLSAESGTAADPVLNCSVAGKSASFTLSDDFMSAQPPLISHEGWDLDATLIVPEGDRPVETLKATVNSAAPLSRLLLSTTSVYLQSRSFPAQVDLLDLSPADAELLRELGLTWAVPSATAATVDFTALVGNLVFLTENDALSSFSLLAEDSQGRVSSPLTLKVTTTPVDIAIENVASVPVGSTVAELTVSSTATGFASHVDIEVFDSASESWLPAAVRSVEPSGNDTYTLKFEIPDSNSDVRARVLYCEEVRAEFTIVRTMPEFALEIDPFATYALIRVSAISSDVVDAVTKGLMLYIDGQRGAVLNRDMDNGLLAISGLEPGRSYVLTSTMMDRPDEADFTPAQKFTTESAPSLPNSDFEKRVDGVRYEGLPSGGRYSQTMVTIFNWQNSESFWQQVPEQWANTNSKTFCRRAANHNTWYMQPSVFLERGDAQNGDFALCLRSVAFDLNGPQIPDYAQTGEPYLKYSPIVPHIAWRAAGKAFLGGYSFSPDGMEENYRDVVKWGSRPRSLNGFYKYSPSPDRPSDAGLAFIEVYGEVDGQREVIASARTYLPVANGYTAFTAQLDYTRFGVKATGLKVMFASSHSIGTIEEETASVVTTPDPVKGASIGSTLWIDNVSLAY